MEMKHFQATTRSCSCRSRRTRQPLKFLPKWSQYTKGWYPNRVNVKKSDPWNSSFNTHDNRFVKSACQQQKLTWIRLDKIYVASGKSIVVFTCFVGSKLARTIIPNDNAVNYHLGNLPLQLPLFLVLYIYMILVDFPSTLKRTTWFFMNINNLHALILKNTSH